MQFATRRMYACQLRILGRGCHRARLQSPLPKRRRHASNCTLQANARMNSHAVTRFGAFSGTDWWAECEEYREAVPTCWRALSSCRASGRMILLAPADAGTIHPSADGRSWTRCSEVARIAGLRRQGQNCRSVRRGSAGFVPHSGIAVAKSEQRHSLQPPRSESASGVWDKRRGIMSAGPRLHPDGAPPASLRTLLSRRSGTFARAWRRRPGAGDGALERRSARRSNRGGQRCRRRVEIPACSAARRQRL